MGGNVGVGKLSTTNKLHVKPDLDTEDPVRFEDLQASTDSADKVVVATSTGVLKTVDGTVSQLKTFIKYNASSGSSLLGISLLGTYTPVGFPLSGREFDENSEFSTTTGVFTAKQDGIYNINFQANSKGLLGAGTLGIGIFKKEATSSSYTLLAEESYVNLNVSVLFIDLDVSPPTRSTQTLVKLNAGDQIVFGTDVGVVGAALLNGFEYQFSIHQVK
ncbi:hypothetical protein [Formosa sp. L2A11]|uniref:hypothetical protein n=1 Tax=Formosa sp. L2A11 TaxID=2686363 RepID=UPI00131B7025|nr:hypothetical protein [Formosa sp. L2A11]